MPALSATGPDFLKLVPEAVSGVGILRATFLLNEQRDKMDIIIGQFFYLLTGAIIPVLRRLTKLFPYSAPLPPDSISSKGSVDSTVIILTAFLRKEEGECRQKRERSIIINMCEEALRVML